MIQWGTALNTIRRVKHTEAEASYPKTHSIPMYTARHLRHVGGNTEIDTDTTTKILRPENTR